MFRAYTNFITVIWPLAGSYELNIRTNILGRAPLWKAQDLEAARDIWQAMRFGEKLSGEDRKVIARVRGISWALKTQKKLAKES